MDSAAPVRIHGPCTKCMSGVHGLYGTDGAHSENAQAWRSMPCFRPYRPQGSLKASELINALVPVASFVEVFGLDRAYPIFFNRSP